MDKNLFYHQKVRTIEVLKEKIDLSLQRKGLIFGTGLYL
jgi:hypothetical protein